MAVALILAAGLGERLRAGRPKALVELAGRPLLQWSVDVLASTPSIERIVVALPADAEAPAGTVGVAGGTVRSESVRLALAAAGQGDPVLVHDAARPLLTAELVQATLAAVGHEGVDAAIAAAPVTDTIKRVTSSHQVGSARSGTMKPSFLHVLYLSSARRSIVQVCGRCRHPRCSVGAFWSVRWMCSEDVLGQATDDAWLVERIGGRVVVVPAPNDNLKVTTSIDLALAELLISRGGA